MGIGVGGGDSRATRLNTDKPPGEIPSKMKFPNESRPTILVTRISLSPVSENRSTRTLETPCLFTQIPETFIVTRASVTTGSRFSVVTFMEKAISLIVVLTSSATLVKADIATSSGSLVTFTDIEASGGMLVRST